MAPYTIYQDENYYPLEFYTGQKANKCYTQLMKQQEIENPDSPECLERLKQAFQFILDYCRDRGLTLRDYVLNKETPMPCYVEHLKNHKINYYTIHALDIPLHKIEARLLDYIFVDFFNVHYKTKTQFSNSKIMKEFANKAKQKLETKLN
jgi:hypothetical protein